MNISILTSQKQFTRGFNDFHPIYRWRKELKNEGFKFKFYNNHKNLREAAILIIDYRYVRTLFGDWTEDAKTFTISLCKRNKGKYNKIIFFDTGDSAGSRCFGVLEHVDLFWKKQILSNLENYLINNGEKNWMCWLPEELNEFSRHYDIPNRKDLKKIKVAWNIGLNGYYETNKWVKTIFSNTIFSKFFLKTKLRNAFLEGSLDSCYRVSINSNQRYSYQRNLIYKNLQNIAADHNISLGGKIPKRDYLNEMKNSRIIISPYGWGEICYRDFEAVINGSLLIKPEMSHLETFPNIYDNMVTYVSVNWNASNLEQTFKNIIDKPENYNDIAKTAKMRFNEHITNPKGFITQLRFIL
jgi:hypothetical protein